MSSKTNHDNFQLKINKKFAAKYEKTKEKQELNALKQKYGDSQSSLNSSSSESEDENAEALTPQVEKDFLTMLSLIKNKDPKIYDNSSKFYNYEDQHEDSNGEKKESQKPIFLKDIERERLLKKGVKALISDSESDDEEGKTQHLKANDLTYVEELKKLKESFKSAIQHSDNEEDFLKLREKSAEEKENQEQDYNEWFTSLKEDKELLIGHEQDNEFLTNYILKKGYKEKDKEIIPSYSSIIEESESDVDEEEQFERKFNFRFEEPDEEFIKRYPRTIKESTRKTDDKRKKKRQMREERKIKEKEVKKEEIRKLKNLKRKEIISKIERLKEITGNSKVGFLEDDLDGDFDPSKHDNIMKNIYDDDYYKPDEEENQKPIFSDSEESQENWDEWDGNYNDAYEAEGGIDTELHCDDPGFNMDADYQPTSKKSRNSMKGKKKNSNLASALSQKKPVFNPDDKTFEEYFDEYYKLDYEDIVGDMPVRFKYRQVLPNSFGLSTDEILKAEDKELNQWCSLRKPIRYNTKEEEWRERLRYKKKARNKQKKARVFPSIYSIQSSTADAEGREEIVNNLSAEKAVVNRTVKSKKKIHTSSNDPKCKVVASKWNYKSKLHGKGLRKLKTLPKSLKQGPQSAMSKLSSSRLAAYGIDTKRKSTKANINHKS